MVSYTTMNKDYYAPAYFSTEDESLSINWFYGNYTILFYCSFNTGLPKTKDHRIFNFILAKIHQNGTVRTGRLLPVLSNQKMNSYLKEITDVCGIYKELTFHIARHTFATTVTLNNGVPIETVSKMLGHTNLKTTQHYAKLLDTKISHDMQRLSEKLEIQTERQEINVS